MHAVDLEKAVEDVAEVTFGYPLAGVGDLESEGLAVGEIGNVDAAVVRGVFESVGQQVEEHTLHFFGVDGNRQRCIVGGEGEFDVALGGDGVERFHPVAHGFAEVYLGGFQCEFAVFELAEVQNLVYETLENARVLIGYADQGVLLGREIVGGGELRHRLGYER